LRAGEQPPKESRPNPQRADPGVRRISDLARRIEHHFDAALAQFASVSSQTRDHVAALASWWDNGAGRIDGVTPGLVPALTCSYLRGEIGEVWARGWQPADIPRIVGRHLSPKHVRVAVDAIAEEAETYRSRRRTLPTWLEQLDEVGAVLRWDPQTDHLARTAQELDIDLAGSLLVAFEVLVMLHDLPSVPVLCPPPSAWDRLRRSIWLWHGGTRRDRENPVLWSGSEPCSPKPSPRSSMRRPKHSQPKPRSS
jgi:hypothetical protein